MDGRRPPEEGDDLPNAKRHAREDSGLRVASPRPQTDADFLRSWTFGRNGLSSPPPPAAATATANGVPHQPPELAPTDAIPAPPVASSSISAAMHWAFRLNRVNSLSPQANRGAVALSVRNPRPTGMRGCMRRAHAFLSPP